MRDYDPSLKSDLLSPQDEPVFSCLQKKKKKTYGVLGLLYVLPPSHIIIVLVL